MSTVQFVGTPSVPKRHQNHRSLRIALICMPWASLDMPSLALSTLKPVAQELDFVTEVQTIYANIRWADFVFHKTGGAIDSEEYRRIVDGYYVATGEWVFSSALYGLESPEQSVFYRAASRAGAELAAAAQMHRMSPEFVDAFADELIEAAYDVIGMTSTFDQNMPSLALARALKKRAPWLVTIMGGANCDDVQGAALHRNFTSLDYVVRGEAEFTFPALLDVIADNGLSADDRDDRLAAIPGLCWRDQDASLQVNEQSQAVVPIGSIPEADVSGYFHEFRKAKVTKPVEPKIQIEGGRGCWWGEKHHCTFCGLNGSSMSFRSKTPERVLHEIENAVRAHRTLDVVFADNIMDMRYVRELMPALAERQWDLRLFFEVKSNLDYAQLRLLAEAGVAQLQPGIESLSTQVLRLMRKGVTGWQNVRMLRDSRTLALYPGWNMLYGFPGESDDDYEPVIQQMAGLHHLTPPEGCYRVVLTRFSPFFNDPSLGLKNLGPSGLLRTVYRLPEEEIAEIGYIFESEPTGILHDTAHHLDTAFEDWRRHFAGSRFVALNQEDGSIRIVDERTSSSAEFMISDPREVDAFRATVKGRTAKSVTRLLSEAGYTSDLDRTRHLLDSWVERRWLFRDGEHYLALTTGLSYE